MELKQAKESLKQLSEDVSRNNQSREQDGVCSVMRETEKSVEFLSDQYDQLNAFRNKAESFRLNKAFPLKFSSVFAKYSRKLSGFLCCR